MTVYVQDPDLTLHHGDVRDVLRTLPDGSVDCVITSPPYWGLRDYGTGAWVGGDEGCDHLRSNCYSASTTLNAKVTDGASEAKRTPYADVCGKCGARRVDNQLGLEPDPATYVTNMVAVFREVRRVLADHGTCWVNLGDSYGGGSLGRNDAGRNFTGGGGNREGSGNPGRQGAIDISTGLKPKDLVGIPWRIAFALQNDGWYLRADIIWAKPNPMPESVTDRPTKAHEYLFLLSKQPRYWFDAEAVREPQSPNTIAQHEGATYTRTQGAKAQTAPAGVRSNTTFDARQFILPNGRNIRSVWEISTQPYSEAHFATFPEELVRRALLAGCPEQVCVTCRKPRERIVDASYEDTGSNQSAGRRDGREAEVGGFASGRRMLRSSETLGWSDCGHGTYRPGRVLDPFGGSGTTALVARKHGRHAILVELSEEYCRLAARRLQQLSLFAKAGA